MILYKYGISRHLKDGKYEYNYSTATLETDENFLETKWDKPIRCDFPDKNLVVHLFNNELAFESFTAGIHFRANMDKEFDSLSNRDNNG